MFHYSLFITVPSQSAIRKLNSDNTLSWMASISFFPIKRGLAVDPKEQYVWLASYTNPLDVARMLASTGAIVDAQRL